MQWQAWAYSVVVLAGYRLGYERWSDSPSRTLVERFRQLVVGHIVARLPGGVVGSGGVRPIFSPTRDRWPEKEELLAGMGNAVAGSLRG